MKADWSKAPDWANYWAMEPDGYSDWFENKPTPIFTKKAVGDGWLANGGRTNFSSASVHDWADSLQKRPTEKAEPK